MLPDAIATRYPLLMKFHFMKSGYFVSKVVIILGNERSSSTVIPVAFVEDFWVLINHVDFGRLGSNVKLSWKLSGIVKLDNGGYGLSYETPEGLVSLQSKSVVLTVPSHIASNLLDPLCVCFILKLFLFPFFDWLLLVECLQVDCGKLFSCFSYLILSTSYVLRLVEVVTCS